MHPYSIDSEERIYITIILFVISFLICYFLNMTLNHFSISIPMYLESPSPFGVFGILYGFFNKYWWRKKWIRFILRVCTPDLNGVWNGEYESSYRQNENTNEKTIGSTTMTIRQSWTKISIESNNGKSNSYSVIAGILCNYHKGIVLKFEYENDSDRNMEDSMKAHTGFNTLKCKLETNELEGTYYNDKNRQTYGTLKYTRG